MDNLRTPAQYIEAVRRRGGEEWKRLGVSPAEVDTLLRLGARIPAAINIQHAWTAPEVVASQWEEDRWVDSEARSFNPTTSLYSQPWNLPLGAIVNRQGDDCENLGWIFRLDLIQSTAFDAGGVLIPHVNRTLFGAYGVSPGGGPPTFLIIADIATASLPGHLLEEARDRPAAVRYLLPDCAVHVQQTGGVDFAAGEVQVITMVGWWEWCPALDRAVTMQ